MMTHRKTAAASLALVLAACSPKPSAEVPAPPATAAAPPAAAPAEAGPGPSHSARPGCVQQFSVFDADGDGRVSLAEFEARPHPRSDPAFVFQARDGDLDGFLTETELCWRRGGPDGRPGMGPGGRHMGPGAGMPCEEHFKRFDANADGSVTEQEFSAMPHAHADPRSVFAARDQDHDGQISKQEFCAAGSPPPSP